MTEDFDNCPPGLPDGLEWVWGRFRRTMRYMAARYNGAVYLCGSVLFKARPGDIDFRVEIADPEFCGRYSYAHVNDWRRQGPNQAWIDDMARRNGEFAEDHRGLPPVDFQVYPVGACIQHRTKPRVLFAAPSNYREHLAESTRWRDTPDEGFHL